MTDAREEVVNQDHQESNGQQSKDHRAVRLPCRSNSTEQTRELPLLVLCSCLRSAVDTAWDEVGCM